MHRLCNKHLCCMHVQQAIRGPYVQPAHWAMSLWGLAATLKVIGLAHLSGRRSNALQAGCILLGMRSEHRGQLWVQNLAEELPPAVRLWAVDTAVVVPSRTMKAYAKAYAYRQVCPSSIGAKK